LPRSTADPWSSAIGAAAEAACPATAAGAVDTGLARAAGAAAAACRRRSRRHKNGDAGPWRAPVAQLGQGARGGSRSDAVSGREEVAAAVGEWEG
jgi:hypothetical protein